MGGLLMSADDDDYEYVPGTFKYKKGHTPDRSRKTRDAWRGTLRDDEGHLSGQAEFIPGDEVDERESTYSYTDDDAFDDYLGYESDEEYDNEAMEALAGAAIAALGVAGTFLFVQAGQYLKNKWEENARRGERELEAREAVAEHSARIADATEKQVLIAQQSAYAQQAIAERAAEQSRRAQFALWRQTPDGRAYEWWKQQASEIARYGVVRVRQASCQLLKRY